MRSRALGIEFITLIARVFVLVCYGLRKCAQEQTHQRQLTRLSRRSHNGFVHTWLMGSVLVFVSLCLSAVCVSLCVYSAAIRLSRARARGVKMCRRIAAFCVALLTHEKTSAHGNSRKTAQ